MRFVRRGIFTLAISSLCAVVTTTASWAQQLPIKIGLITPITGPLASYGKIQSIIVSLAVDDINAKGRVNGSLVQLDVGDSQTDNGIQVLETVEFSSKSTDLSAAAIQIKNRSPHAILVAAFPAQGMLLAKEFSTQGVNVPVFSTATLWSGPFINMVGELGRNWHV